MLVANFPLSVGIVRGFRRIAVTAASLLLLLYAGVVTVAAETDRALQRDLSEQVRHEGRFYAKMLGEPWPDN